MQAHDTAVPDAAQRRRLTDKQVQALKPQASAYRRTDENGLFLTVHPSGLKTWHCLYTPSGGKRTKYKLGEYPEMSLADARKARQDVRVTVRDGGNPKHVRALERQQRIERESRTFEVEARKVHERLSATKWSEDYATQFLQRLEKYAFPHIGKTPIGLVTHDNVRDLLTRCAERSSAQATHVRQHLLLLFKMWMKDSAKGIDRNPADYLADEFPEEGRKEQPAALTVEAVRQVLATFEQNPKGSTMLKLLHRFQALTGVRPSEASEAEWKEFEKPGLWCIPAERMKGKKGKKKPHTVFLSPQAQEVIEVARKLKKSADAVYVFATDHYGTHRDKPFHRGSLAGRLALLLGKRKHVAHGWRSALRTILGRLNRRDKDLIELMLAHQNKGQVERLYDRTTEMDFEEDLRRLWNQWANLLLEGAPSAWSFIREQQELDDVRKAA